MTADGRFEAMSFERLALIKRRYIGAQPIPNRCGLSSSVVASVMGLFSAGEYLCEQARTVIHRQRKREAFSFGAPTNKRAGSICNWLRAYVAPLYERQSQTTWLRTTIGGHRPVLQNSARIVSNGWPIMLGFNRQSRRVQGVSRKEELTFELRGPSGLR